MSKLPLRAAWKMALTLSVLGLAATAIGSAAWAVDASHATPAIPPTDVLRDGGNTPPAGDDAKGSLLPDRPDLTQDDGDALGPLYINHTAGIELHVPRGSRKVLQVSQDILAEFDDPNRHWELKIAMVVREKPTVLTTRSDLNPSGRAPDTQPSTQPGASADNPAEGLMERTLDILKRTLPGAKVLREDLTSLPNGDQALENNVGLLAVRYTAAGGRRLAQQALIQASDRVFYVLTLTSPGKSDDSAAADDPRETEAVNTFRQVLDSISLLDRASIRQDQEDRLYRTRALFVNFTPARLKSVLIPEQWLRIIRDGKDVGYTYVCEQQAGDIPRIGQVAPKHGNTPTVEMHRDVPIPPGDDILIGVRSTTLDDAMRSDKTMGLVRVDSESWLFCTVNRDHEEWSREILVNEGLKTADGKPKKPFFQEEIGDSNRRIKEVSVPAPADAPIGTQGTMEPKEVHKLEVTDVNSGAALPSIERDLPPFYTPQAISHLLPRLLDLHQQRGYLFATYVGDAREVMMRYVDVLPQRAVNIMGKSEFAIPIDDRIGLDGQTTTYYYSPKGVFLGSENEDTNVWVIPTDADTLQKIWSNNANLTTPKAVQSHHSEADAGQ